MRCCWAQRLGHGVRLIEDPVTLHYAMQKAIPIEINLTSNLKLGAVKDIRQHPFLTYLRLGLPVQPVHRRRRHFQTDIVQECELAVGQTDMSYQEYKDMALNSIRTAFVADGVKAPLLQALQQRFAQFESP